MRVTYLDLDITSAELAESPRIAAVIDRMIRTREESEQIWVRSSSDIDPVSSDLADVALEEPTPTDPIPGVSPDGQAAVQKLLDENPAGELFRAFLAEVTTWPGVAVHGIKLRGSDDTAPRDFTRYLRLRRSGSQLGGFAYGWPVDGSVNMRLNYDTDAELHDLAPAASRTSTGHREYRVWIKIEDEATLEQTITLARIAYDLT